MRADIAEFSDEIVAFEQQEPENQAEGDEKFRNRQTSDMNKLENEFKLIETEVDLIFWLLYNGYNVIQEDPL